MSIFHQTKCPNRRCQVDQNELWDAVYAQDYTKAQKILEKLSDLQAVNEPSGVSYLYKN